MSSAERIAIGIIKRPVGLDGRCAVEAFGATLPDLSTPRSVFLGRDAVNAGSVVLSDIVARSNGVQVRFEGKGDRDSVEGLRGQYLFIENDALPELPPNEYYHDELKGMEVVSDITGSVIGKVTDVLNLPSMDTVDVTLKNGQSVLIPLGGVAVSSIDRSAKRITVSQSFIEELLE